MHVSMYIYTQHTKNIFTFHVSTLEEKLYNRLSECSSKVYAVWGQNSENNRLPGRRILTGDQSPMEQSKSGNRVENV